MRRVLLLLALVAPLLTAAPAASHDRAACSTSNSLTAKLAEQATYVEHNVTTKAGTVADDAYHFVSAVSQEGRIIPVHAGGVHAFETAYSPNGGPGGDYLYYADLAILHWESQPCSGPDNYAFAVTVQCGHADFSTTHCLFDAWAGLQTSTFGGTNPWVADWGYSHRKNASPRQSCYAQGGQHAIPDERGWVRTWLYLDGSFTGPSPDWPFNARKTTSKEQLTLIGAGPHQYENGVCWPDWCDATTPPNNNSSVVFNSCQV